MPAPFDADIQAAIYEALTSDATLMSKITGVFDHVPEKQAFNYVTLGDITSNEWGSHTFDGANSTITIHTWARGAGRKTAKNIMADIYRVLHNASLPIDGLVLLRWEFSETMKDPDGQTIHGVQRFRTLSGG